MAILTKNDVCQSSDKAVRMQRSGKLNLLDKHVNEGRIHTGNIVFGIADTLG